MPHRALVVIVAMWTIGAFAEPANAAWILQPASALSGRVVLPDSVTRAAGIVIEAVMESDPSVRVRALSNPDGDFTLPLGRAGAWRVAAMRIGYTPTTLGRFVLDAGEHRRLATPTVLSGVAVRFTLARLEIHEADICGRSTDEAGLLVATLLAQARAALASTVLTQAAGGARAEWQTFAIFTDRTGTPISPLRLTPHAAATERPFGAAPIEALMSRGYYWDSQQQVQFHAPDAHVLLSEPFVGSHCYRVSAPHAERPEWIGVAFAPAEQRLGIVEVHGTLWLDRESAELRRLDFGYVDLPDDIEAAKPRGQVDFLRLPTDAWVVSRWELRLPRTDAVLSGTGNVRAAPARQLNVMKISGGELMTVHRGRRELFRNQVHPVERFPALSDRVGMPPVCLDAPERRPGESGVLFGSIVDTLGNPVNATVRILWSDIGRRRSVNADQELFVSANDGVYIACGLTLGARLRVTGYVGTDRTGEETLVLLRAPRTWASVDLTIP